MSAYQGNMKTISHYDLVERIGSGGMGEVFLAHDRTLARKVALKLLPQQFTQDAQRLQRFQKEARLVSALNHPNILTIFEIGSADGEHFIVTEYIEGETLRQRASHGRLSLTEIVDIAIGVASALAEAHKAGVIHRDIKPENVMIRRDGLVKVLDFGLAKRSSAGSGESATAIRETAPGTVLGTVSYMSPEQARGFEVDARSDLFSLGAVLYEALTGHIPFEGETSTDILAAILHRDVPPVTRYTSEVPREVQWIVEKALHKDRDERYQTAKEMLADLRRVRRQLDVEGGSASISGDTPQVDSRPPSTSGPSPVTDARSISSAEYIVSGIRTHRKSVAGVVLVVLIAVAALLYVTSSTAKTIDSVAVLPFANSSGDPAIDYLAEGLTENLINSLSEISGLRVVPRSSVFRYKDSALAVEDIARELGARAILTGRLRKQGEVVTIQAELVDAAERSQLWGDRIETSMTGIADAERMLAQQSAAKLRPHLSGTEQQRVEKAHTQDAEAYDLYLKARYYWNKRTPEDIRTAIDFLRRALDRDPNFALAWAAMADAHTVLPNYDETVAPSDMYPRAREAAQRALQIDPAIAEAHASLAGVLFEYDWKPAEAEKEFRRAIELKPNYAPARYWYADFLAAMSRHEEALEQATKAREADPLSVIAASAVALYAFHARGPDAALTELKKLEELAPESWRVNLIRGLVYRSKGMKEEAAREAEMMARSSGLRSGIWALALRGRKDEALALVRQYARAAEGDDLKAYNIAGMYAVLEERDEAMRWLERAAQVRSARLPYLTVDERFTSMYGDPRFIELLSRMNIPPPR